MIGWAQVEMVADLTTAAAYLVIGLLIAVPLVRSRQLWANKLGTATAAIFLSAAVAHVLRAVHLITAGTAGVSSVWWQALWFMVTAAVAFSYLILRQHDGRLMLGAPMFDDLSKRERLADLERIEAEVNARAAAAAAAEAERDFYASMMEGITENSHSLISVKDLDGRYLMVNPAFERDLGVNRVDAVGRTVDELLPQVNPTWREADLRAREGRYQTEEFRDTPDGRRYYNSVKFPIYNVDQTLHGIGGIAQDITRLKRINEAVEEARDAALAAGAAKSAFLATMSHEIRTPMNAVIGMTDLLLDSPLDAQQQDFIATIRTSGDALLAVIDDVLDFSKIESGSLRLTPAPFRLRDVVEKAMDMVAVTAARSDLDLVSFVDDCPPSMIGDAARLRQIIINLLSNAVKFTPVGSVLLTVTCSPAEQSRLKLTVQVADTGIGISTEGVPKLFSSFSQVDTSSTRAYGGTGLGLAISQRLARAMGGDIVVKSTPDVGSTFTVTLLLDPDPNVSDQDENLPDPVVAGRSVLIVDDNPTNLRILDVQLTRLGMVATAAATPAEALHLARDGCTFDIAVLDFKMPEMDGIELAEALRVLPTYGATPLVLLTSVGDRPPSSDLNFAAVVTKPVKRDALHRALALALRTAPTGVSPSRCAQPRPQDTSTTRPLRILLAEDNPVNQRVAKLMLDKLGHEADVVNNGLEAVQAATTSGYDVILMDIQMPQMDGLAAARRIRDELEPDRRPPIIALTASALLEDQQACAAAGMTTYLTKPVRSTELGVALEGLAASSRAPATLEATAASGRTLPARVDLMAAPAVETGVLDELKADLEDTDGTEVTELIDTYLDSTRTLIPQLAAALRSGQTGDAVSIAHALISGTAMLGARQLADLLQQVRSVQDHPELMSSLSTLITDESKRVTERLSGLCGEIRVLPAAATKPSSS